MLPVPPTVGFEDEELASGVMRRGRTAANYRRELARWFDEGLDAPETAPLRAVGTNDRAPAAARIPFLIF